MQYEIVKALTTQDLEHGVERMITEGMEPTGGLEFCAGQPLPFAQAMVATVSETNEPVLPPRDYLDAVVKWVEHAHELTMAQLTAILGNDHPGQLVQDWVEAQS